jgi:hypothetical protein
MDILVSSLESGAFFNWVLMGIAVEAIALRLWLGASKIRSLLPNLVAGAALMLAVKLAVTHAQWQWLASALTIALLAHMVDVISRLSAKV